MVYTRKANFKTPLSPDKKVRKNAHKNIIITMYPLKFCILNYQALHFKTISI